MLAMMHVILQYVEESESGTWQKYRIRCSTGKASEGERNMLNEYAEGVTNVDLRCGRWRRMRVAAGST